MLLLRRCFFVNFARGFSTVREDRNDYCFYWGRNDDGNITLPALLPEAPDQKVVQVSMGLFHSAILTDQGKLFTWGRGYGGRLGTTEKMSSSPSEMATYWSSVGAVPFDHLSTPDKPVKVKHVSCGGQHTLAALDDGRLTVFGFGAFGQLGVGQHIPEIHLPYVNSLISDVTRVASGGMHSMVLCKDGGVYSFGRSDFGRLGHDDVFETLLAPKRIKTLDGQGVVDIVAGGFNSAAITEDGRLYTWGGGQNGELAHPDYLSKIVPTVVEALSGTKIVSVSLGAFHSAALTATGEVLTWGLNSMGQLGRLSPSAERQLPDVVSGFHAKAVGVACGGIHTLVLLEDGTLWGTGGNSDGQLGQGTTKKTSGFVQIDLPWVVTVGAGGSRSFAACTIE